MTIVSSVVRCKRTFALGLIALLSPVLAVGQGTEVTNDYMLESGDVLLSAGVGTSYSAFASTWGGDLGFEVTVSSVDIGLPLVFGVGAVGYLYTLTSSFAYAGSTVKANHTLWGAGAHGTAHFLVTSHIDIYAKIGIAYQAYASPDTVEYNGGKIPVPSLKVDAVGFFGSAGVNIFLSDFIAIYVEPRLSYLTAGVRIKL